MCYPVLSQIFSNWTACGASGAASAGQPPVFDPPGGSETPVTVYITTSTEEATIYYTIDGTIPTTSSSVYTDPISINDPVVLQAIAVK